MEGHELATTIIIFLGRSDYSIIMWTDNTALVNCSCITRLRINFIKLVGLMTRAAFNKFSGSYSVLRNSAT